MLQSKLEDAQRRALDLFERWNDVVGVFTPGTADYYGIQGCIQDAVEIGVQAAVGQHKKLFSEEEEYLDGLQAAYEEFEPPERG